MCVKYSTHVSVVSAGCRSKRREWDSVPLQPVRPWRPWLVVACPKEVNLLIGLLYSLSGKNAKKRLLVKCCKNRATIVSKKICFRFSSLYTQTYRRFISNEPSVAVIAILYTKRIVVACLPRLSCTRHWYMAYYLNKLFTVCGPAWTLSI